MELKIRKARKTGEALTDLEVALKEAQSIVDRYASDMGDMTNSSRTLTNYYVLPADVELAGRLVIENARDRDLPMVELALNALSFRPILGAQSARGCGEIEGAFDVFVDGVLVKKITVGGWKPAKVIAFLGVDGSEIAA